MGSEELSILSREFSTMRRRLLLGRRNNHNLPKEAGIDHVVGEIVAAGRVRITLVARAVTESHSTIFSTVEATKGGHSIEVHRCVERTVEGKATGW